VRVEIEVGLDMMSGDESHLLVDSSPAGTGIRAILERFLLPIYSYL
jgi:hypothetical protein